MRKLILIIMLIILATFTIPIIFTIRFGDGEKNVKETGGTVENIGNNELDEEKKENFAPNGASLMGENYEYKRYGTVKVLHTKDNSIEEMKMDEYLLGVVSAEMPADFEEEALKAQAVVARMYTKLNITKVNMGKRIFVTILRVARLGYLKRIGWLDGMKIKEKVIGRR